MTNISVSVEKELVEWIDQLIQNGVIKNRSEAVKGGIYTYIRKKIGINSREELRQYIKSKQKQSFQEGKEAIRSVREEE
jgi:Arc/MetJ-type ribon-helix-helix transcriptional regulator